MPLAKDRYEACEMCNGHLTPPFNVAQSLLHHHWWRELADGEQVHSNDFAILAIA